MLAVQPICVLGASWASHPDPVGEKVYRPHLLLDMLPVALIVCVVLLAVLLSYYTHRKAKKHVSGETEVQHIG
jgi:hypothetical protein